MGKGSEQDTRTQSSTKQDPWVHGDPVAGADVQPDRPAVAERRDHWTEQGAFDALQQNANKGNPYAAQIGQTANDLLSGGKDRTGMVNTTLDEYRQGLLPYANGSTNPTRTRTSIAFSPTRPTT
jgi:hypothetical protein